MTLTAPSALTDKLHRRLQWPRDGDESLELPKKSRTMIRGMELAAGAWIDVSFKFIEGGPTLTSSHSLAIRQLWRGEEVGRITWFFGNRDY